MVMALSTPRWKSNAWASARGAAEDTAALALASLSLRMYDWRSVWAIGVGS